MQIEWSHYTRPEIQAGIEASLAATAVTGTWWSGEDRVTIAELARAARAHEPGPQVGLATPAIEATEFLAARPAHTTDALVHTWAAGLGEPAYVELVGVVARTVAVDTFHRVLGRRPPAFGEPDRSRPARNPVPTKPGRAWIAMTGFEVPPNTLSAVPSEQAAANHLEAAFYMTGEQMEDPDQRRGHLHRTQIELVAATLSHANECFY